MTTAHRPTFDAARAGSQSTAPTRQYSSRSLPAHKVLKYRKVVDSSTETPNNDGPRISAKPDLDSTQIESNQGEDIKIVQSPAKAEIECAHQAVENTPSVIEALGESDLESETSIHEHETESDSEEDETAELMRELEQIKKERSLQQMKREASQAEAEASERESQIAFGNPLLNASRYDSLIQRRWNEDVVFRVQDAKTPDKKEFVNDLLRSDFHRSFMKKYVR